VNSPSEEIPSVGDSLLTPETPSIGDISSTPFKAEAESVTESKVLAQKESESYYEYEERINRAKADREEERVKILQQDRQERQKYAKYLFKLICAWLLGIYSIIMLAGFGATVARFDMSDVPVVKRLEFKPSFKLSDAVLLALIGGTTINVLGLFVIVANYLFNSPKDPEDPN